MDPCAAVWEILSGKALQYRYDDVARLLQRCGFTLCSGQGGTHRVWRHACGERVMVRDDGSRRLLPAYPKAAAKAIVRAGFCPEERPKV